MGDGGSMIREVLARKSQDELLDLWQRRAEYPPATVSALGTLLVERGVQPPAADVPAEQVDVGPSDRVLRLWTICGFLIGAVLYFAANVVRVRYGLGGAWVLVLLYLVVAPLLLHPASVVTSLAGPLLALVGWAPTAVGLAILGRPLYILLVGYRNSALGKAPWWR